MKRLLFLLALIFAAFFTFAAGQEVADPDTGFNLAQLFGNLAALAAIVPVVTQFVLNRIKTKYDQLFSWLVALVLSVFAWVFKIGIFAGVEWYWILIYAASAGLVSNGIFDIAIVKAILSLIPKKE